LRRLVFRLRRATRLSLTDPQHRAAMFGRLREAWRQGGLTGVLRHVFAG
jgi:hypothetical protein